MFDQHHIHVVDRAALDDASNLIATYGDFAALEAASRAESSRTVGNVIHYCRWRQIERLIGVLRVEDATGTVH